MHRDSIRALPIVAVAVVATLLLSPSAAFAQERVVRTINETFDPSGYEAIAIDLSSGEVKVEGASVSRIAAEVRIRCPRGRDLDRCRERAEDVELGSRERRGKLILDIDGPGMWGSRDAQLEVILVVPMATSVEIDLGAGEVDVENLGGDVTVDLGAGEVTLTDVGGDVVVDAGAGEVTVRMSEDVVRSVTLDNGIGETFLQHRNGRRTREGIMAGTDVRWNDGPGSHTVEIDLNVGEITVRLH